MKRLPVALCVAAMVPACGEGQMLTSLSAESTGNEITNGAEDTGHPSVGKLTESGFPMCTATLVGKRTVLCAAHCIQDASSSYAFELASGSYALASATVHPKFDKKANSGRGTNDISVLILKEAPSETPSPISSSAPFVGEVLTLVGYGSFSSEDLSGLGTKRVANNTITKIGGTLLYWDASKGAYEGQSTCFGDSGGPAFATVDGVEVDVGITSAGKGACGEGLAWDTNVYLFKDWISQVAAGDVVIAK